MTRTIRALILLVALLALVACATVPTLAPTAIKPTVAPTTFVIASPAFDGARAFEFNRHLAVNIGTRVAGTESGIKAGEYIAEQFKSFGYPVEKQAFSFDYWEDLGTRLGTTVPEVRQINSVRPIQYSPPGHLTEELVAVGGVGNESDFAKVSAKGKIALVQRGVIPFSEKAKNAASAGAFALIVYNNAPGPFAGTLAERSVIPVIGISGQDGQTLLDLLKNGAVKIRVDSDTRITQKNAYNIIATKRGASDNTIVIGGRYDSVDGTQGANDNGSGTAVVLELARGLAAKSFKHTLVFIAFDAEEFGLLGSRYYAEHLTSADRAKIRAMFNFDMLGGGAGGLGISGDGALGQLTRNAARELGFSAGSFQLPPNAGSDHQSFQRINVDTAFFSRDYDLLHTPQDVIGEIKEPYLAEAGRVTLKALETLESQLTSISTPARVSPRTRAALPGDRRRTARFLGAASTRAETARN